MDATQLATAYGAELPAWVLGEVAAAAETLTTLDERMALVHRLAARNPTEGNGGPFAALVVERDTGVLVSAGVNLVLSSNLSAAHAEVVALSLAQTRLGQWDLGTAGDPPRELVVNWRPCAQCYGALIWSGVTRLVIAGSGPELEQLTHFDEGPVRDDWDDELRRCGIEVVTDVLRDEALAVFAAYGERVGAGHVTVYNARGTGPTE